LRPGGSTSDRFAVEAFPPIPPRGSLAAGGLVAGAGWEEEEEEEEEERRELAVACRAEWEAEPQALSARARTDTMAAPGRARRNEIGWRRGRAAGDRPRGSP
jgi:hypothetical protein